MHYHGFNGTHIMSGCPISSRPSMLGQSGISNGTISSCMSLSHVGPFNLYSGFLHCGKFVANLKCTKRNLNIAHNFYKIAQNLA